MARTAGKLARELEQDIPVVRRRRDRQTRQTRYPHSHYRIKIEDNDKIPPGGQYIGLNGRNWLITSGVEVVVPRGVLYVLDDAVESIPITDRNTGRVASWSQRKKYPFQIVEAVVEEDELPEADFETTDV
jgi:hypothetical protein